MKQLFTFFIILISSLSFGQNSKSLFLQDLDFVYENLKKTASYKTQKNNHENVDKKYNELKTQYQNTELGTFESFIKLYELVDEIVDYHNEIYGNSETFTYNDIKDEAFLNKIKASSDYSFYPKSKMNLDSLETELSKRKTDDYEGIYYYKNYFKIAIVKKSDSLLEGIVLETKIPSWQRGETILYLQHKLDNRFRIFGGQFIDKKLFSSNDRFVGGEFKVANWQKTVSDNNFYNANFPKETYVEKVINENYSYIKLGSFNSSNDGIVKATDFCNKIKKHLNAKNLIVDLRNNYGGGDKTSSQFYKLLKTFNGKIYLLTNFNTVSNAEQFTLKMKNLKNVTILGDNTRGMLTYGRNYPEDKETPSKKYRIYFSDLKDNWKQYLKYEGIGIKPDVYLNAKKDWIEQTIEKYSH